MKAYSKLIPPVIGLLAGVLVKFGLPEYADMLNTYLIPLLVAAGVYQVPANQSA